MLKVTCNICKENGKTIELVSSVIPRNNTESLQLTAVEMANHLNATHPKELNELMKNTIKFNALQAMIMFSSEDGTYNKALESERDDLCAVVMNGAPEDEEEEELDEEEEDIDFEEGGDEEGDEEEELDAEFPDEEPIKAAEFTP